MPREKTHAIKSNTFLNCPLILCRFKNLLSKLGIISVVLISLYERRFFLVFQTEYVFELPRLELLIFSFLSFPSLSQEITFGEELKRCRRRGEWGCSSSALRLITLCLGLLRVLKSWLKAEKHTSGGGRRWVLISICSAWMCLSLSPSWRHSFTSVSSCEYRFSPFERCRPKGFRVCYTTELRTDKVCSGGSLPRKHSGDGYRFVFLNDRLRFYFQENGFYKKNKRQNLYKSGLHFWLIMKYDFKNDLNSGSENKTDCFGVVGFILKVPVFIMSRMSVIFTLSWL